MQQHIGTTHQTCLEPHHPAPQQKWHLQLDMQNMHLSYVGQTSRNLKTRFQEHIRYIKTNNPQSAYAQHILHNRHEYGTMAETMTLIKPIQNESMLLSFEQFHIQSLHQKGKLIPEQYPNDPNPLFQLAFSHPPPTRQSQ
jgi:2-phosphoglycerate kinase